MSGRQRRRSRGLVGTLALVAWILVAAGLAHPTPGAAIAVVFVAGLITGGALVYHSATDPRPKRPAPRRSAASAASRPPTAAATPRPASSPHRGPGPQLHAVPPVGPNHPDAIAALRANLAAQADRVSTRIPKPPDTPEQSR